MESLTNLDGERSATLHCLNMRCGSCGWDNPTGITFCTNCGKRATEGAGAPQPAVVSAALPAARLGTQVYLAAPAAPAADAVVCPRCRAPSSAGLRFCRECGASLTGPAVAGGARSLRPLPDPTPQPFPPQLNPPPVQAGTQVAARLVMLLRDGSEGRAIPLGTADTDIGGREGDLTFDDDPYLSPRHARVSCRGGTYTLRDLDSVNGVYVRLREAVDLRDRDMVLLGQQVLRFEALVDGELPLGPAWQGGVLIFGTPELSRFARLVQYTTEGVGRDVHYLFRDETVIGRENGDIVFTDDPFMSRRHAAIRIDHAGRRFTLHDLGSSNGTAIRIRGEHVLRNGDQFRIGRHLFRFEANSAVGSPLDPRASGDSRGPGASMGGRAER